MLLWIQHPFSDDLNVKSVINNIGLRVHYPTSEHSEISHGTTVTTNKSQMYSRSTIMNIKSEYHKNFTVYNP